jgi:hypothetical protein
MADTDRTCASPLAALRNLKELLQNVRDAMKRRESSMMAVADDASTSSRTTGKMRRRKPKVAPRLPVDDHPLADTAGQIHARDLTIALRNKTIADLNASFAALTSAHASLVCQNTSLEHQKISLQTEVDAAREESRLRRRAVDEMTEKMRQLEVENARLREENDQLRDLKTGREGFLPTLLTAVLRDANPAFDAEASLKVAGRFHKMMVARGWMDMTGRHPTSNPRAEEDGSQTPLVEWVDMVDSDDNSGRTVPVPVLTNQFRRNCEITCAICTEVIHDFGTPAEDHASSSTLPLVPASEAWAEALGPFAGAGNDCLWKAPNLPFQLAERCTHSLDICKHCLARCIEVNVSELGRHSNPEHEIRCPTLKCARGLTRDEIRTYAARETLDR